MDIGARLRDLGLERYADSFEAHAIDSEVLLELTEADLEKLGVVLGHRKKLPKAIAAVAGQTQAAPTLPADAGIPPSAMRPEAERQQLTVLFCGLVGSSELAARLDPEDMGAIIRTHHRCCAKMVERGVLTSTGPRDSLHLAFPAMLASRWMPGQFPERAG